MVGLASCGEGTEGNKHLTGFSLAQHFRFWEPIKENQC